jgi:hypothetical protein
VLVTRSRYITFCVSYNDSQSGVTFGLGRQVSIPQQVVFGLGLTFKCWVSNCLPI